MTGTNGEGSTAEVGWSRPAVDRSNKVSRRIAEAMDLFHNGPGHAGNPYAIDYWQRMYEQAVLPALANAEDPMPTEPQRPDPTKYEPIGVHDDPYSRPFRVFADMLRRHRVKQVVEQIDACRKAVMDLYGGALDHPALDHLESAIGEVERLAREVPPS